jgi:enoyl-CoA hydratase/carnithine racemase
VRAQIGLVNAVVPHHQMLSTSRELAGRIIRHPPQAVAAIITAATRGMNVSIGEGLLVESAEFAAVAAQATFGKALAAWASRDRANLTGA